MNEDADNSNQLQSDPKTVEEKIKKFLEEKWKSDGCQICGEREFFPFDSVMKITEFSPNKTKYCCKIFIIFLMVVCHIN